MLKGTLKHMFSGKSLKYRLYTITWTAIACKFWTGSWFETFELTATIVIGKFLYYGFWEFWHMEVRDDDWCKWKHELFDYLIIVSAIVIETLLLWKVLGKFLGM